MPTSKFLKIKIIAFTDESYPGWVLCSFKDTKGEIHEFEEKIPIVTAEDIDKNTAFPKYSTIECEIVSVTNNIATVDTSTFLGILIDGNGIFQVFKNQLADS